MLRRLPPTEQEGAKYLSLSLINTYCTYNFQLFTLMIGHYFQNIEEIEDQFLQFLCA